MRAQNICATSTTKTYEKNILFVKKRRRRRRRKQTANEKLNNNRKHFTRFVASIDRVDDEFVQQERDDDERDDAEHQERARDRRNSPAVEAAAELLVPTGRPYNVDIRTRRRRRKTTSRDDIRVN